MSDTSRLSRLWNQCILVFETSRSELLEKVQRQKRISNSAWAMLDNHNLPVIGGPTRTRTWDQWIHSILSFLKGADYLITLVSGCGTL